MYVVTGASGQTGSHVLKMLLERRLPARALVRRQKQADAWRDAGAEACVVDLADQRELARAFVGARGVYLMNPPAYAAPDIFAAAAAIHSAGISAAKRAGLLHVVALSSVGAQHDRGTGNILPTRDLEQGLRGLERPRRNFAPLTLGKLGVVAGTGARDRNAAIGAEVYPMSSPVTHDRHG